MMDISSDCAEPSLNEALRNVVSGVICRYPQSGVFLGPCSALDYRRFVPLSEDMHLQRILAKTHSGEYVSVEQFMRDFERIKRNARLYFGSGQAVRASSEMLQWADELHEACKVELEQHPQLRVFMSDPPQPTAEVAMLRHPALLSARCPTHLSLDSDHKEEATDQQPLTTDSMQASDASQHQGALSDAQHTGLSTEDYPTQLPMKQDVCQSHRIHQMGARPQSHNSFESSEQDEVEGEEDLQPIRKRATLGAYSARPPISGRQPARSSFDNAHGSSFNGPWAHNLGQAYSLPTSMPSATLSSLEALVAACELAAEKEGLDDDCRYYEELVAESPAFNRAAVAGHSLTFAMPNAILSVPGAGAESKGRVRDRGADAVDPGYLAGSTGGTVGTWPAAGGGSGDNASGTKYRRHKSKVFIRPNKVVYLPTTFMEEAFNPACLPINCEMVVEADGAMVVGEKHLVTIKAVPRQGLSTMYCMTNVMKFQQQYLNWQILNWTKIDDHHIKIHLQGPNSCPVSNSGRTSSMPAPRPATAARAGSGCGPMLDDALACLEPLPGEGADALHSLSSNGTDCHDTEPRSTSGGGSEAVRRSARSVRLTAQMVEHLQQERQELAERGLRAGGGGGPPHAAGSPVSPCTAASHKRRNGLNPDLSIDALVLPAKGKLEDPQAGLNNLGKPFHHHHYSQQQTTTTFPPAAASFMYGGMEGSATANLYYMPPSGSNSKAFSPAVITNATGADPAGHAHMKPRASAPAAAGMLSQRFTGGPRCIVTPGNPGTGTSTLIAWDRTCTEKTGPQEIPRLPGALAMFGSVPGFPLSIPGGASESVDHHRVGMLGPSLPSCMPSASQQAATVGGNSCNEVVNAGGVLSSSSLNAEDVTAAATSTDSGQPQATHTFDGPKTGSASEDGDDAPRSSAARPCIASPGGAFKRFKAETLTSMDVAARDVEGHTLARPELDVPPAKSGASGLAGSGGSISVGPGASSLRSFGSCPNSGVPPASPPLMLGGSSTFHNMNTMIAFSRLPPAAQLQLHPVMVGFSQAGLQGISPQHMLGMMFRGIGPTYPAAGPEWPTSGPSACEPSRFTNQAVAIPRQP